MTRANSWGLLNYAPTEVREFASFQKSPDGTGKPLGKFIAMGAGRSYGDVGLNPGSLGTSTSHLSKMLSFDERLGVLECESGVLIREIQSTFSSRGWISPVTPGTSFVTVGGAIANDVHGKNHFSMGSFGNHVLELVLLRTNGEEVVCSETQNSEMFAATIGGLGLTGVILSAKIALARIPSPWVQSEKKIFHDLTGFFELSQESEQSFESSVAWFDCSTRKAGRGSFVRGNHAHSDREAPRTPDSTIKFPLTPPFSLVNRFSLSPMNMAYFQLQKLSKGVRLESMWDFYYPLDSIRNWNRAYGPKGFYQYQSVIPLDASKEATEDMMSIISKSGMGSFLAVLKKFGSIPSKGLLSFPMEGVTLALDFPNNGVKTERLFKELDAVVLAAKGRLNPSKDARMSKEMFEAGYPQISEFLNHRDDGITSGFSKRMFGS
jgi:FAD/FMN-containing dehydrogenase